MSLPHAVAATLLRFGVSAESLALLDDQHHLLGDAVVDALAALVAEEGLAGQDVGPHHVARLRARVAERFLRTHHAAWVDGRPTPGFWRDRSMNGGTGITIPLGDLEQPRSELVRRVAETTRHLAGPGQPPPRGLLLSCLNSHLGNQAGSFAVDVVPSALEDALGLARADGRHHTLPGSIGQASGVADDEARVALVWEVQPNIWKPRADRNRSAGALWRSHRTWPLACAVAVLAWLLDRSMDVYVLDGSALRATHEVDPAAPLGDAIAAHHDRTFSRAAEGLGLRLEAATEGDLPPALHGLTKLGLADELARRGAAAVLRRLVREG